MDSLNAGAGQGKSRSYFPEWTWWYGVMADPETGNDTPYVAYHPKLRKNTLDGEIAYLLKKYGRSIGLGGFELNPEWPRSMRFSTLKLWASWEGEYAIFSVRQIHPVDVSIPGRELVGGACVTDRAMFMRWAKAVQEIQGLALTLLNDDLQHQYERIQLLIERFCFTID